MNNFGKPNVNDVLDAKILAKGRNGDGLFKHNGLVIFVPNTFPDQEVKVKITKVCRSIAFGEVLQ